MYDFTGCECTVCHQHFRLDSDVVVCPDCGTPHHRECYASLGHCKNQALHGTDFVWQPPELQNQNKLISCPRCHAENEKTNEYCKQCGLPLAIANDFTSTAPKETSPEPSRVSTSDRPIPPKYLRNAVPFYGKPLDQNETFESIPVAEWIAYIGAASPAYLTSFYQMKTLHRKYSFSFGAMLFGPLYFFYRKVWGVAILFSLLSFILNIPSFLLILMYSESAYLPTISESTLLAASNIAVALNWAFIMLRGLYGNYLYKKSSAKTIAKIKTRAKSAKEKAFLLRMYGGTSFGAAVLAVVATVALAGLFSTLLGTNLDALISFINA